MKLNTQLDAHKALIMGMESRSRMVKTRSSSGFVVSWLVPYGGWGFLAHFFGKVYEVKWISWKFVAVHFNTPRRETETLIWLRRVKWRRRQGRVRSTDIVSWTASQTALENVPQVSKTSHLWEDCKTYENTNEGRRICIDPMMLPNGQHKPNMGKAKVWFVESVTSPIADRMTAALAEKIPADERIFINAHPRTDNYHWPKQREAKIWV